MILDQLTENVINIMAQFEGLPDIKKIFTKYDISNEAQKELENAFEKLIIKAFYKELKNPKIAHADVSVSPVSPVKGICIGKFYPGTAKEKPCTFKVVNGEYCKRHDPDKVSTGTGTPKKKVVNENSCNAIVKATKKQCKWKGTIKPDGSEFHYCKRHSERWEDFEEGIKVEDDE